MGQVCILLGQAKPRQWYNISASLLHSFLYTLNCKLDSKAERNIWGVKYMDNPSFSFNRDWRRSCISLVSPFVL